jgi:hypothetical protein
MSTPSIIMWMAVFAVAVVSAFRNPAAAALVLAWMANEAVSTHTGDPLPTWFYIYTDIAVLGVLLYRALGHEYTLADKTVALLFPVAWVFYVAGLHDYYLYYALWAITLTQFFAVGWEALPPILRFAEAVSDTPGNSSGGQFQFALARRGYG